MIDKIMDSISNYIKGDNEKAQNNPDTIAMNVSDGRARWRDSVNALLSQLKEQQVAAGSGVGYNEALKIEKKTNLIKEELYKLGASRAPQRFAVVFPNISTEDFNTLTNDGNLSGGGRDKIAERERAGEIIPPQQMTVDGVYFNQVAEPEQTTTQENTYDTSTVGSVVGAGGGGDANTNQEAEGGYGGDTSEGSSDDDYPYTEIVLESAKKANGNNVQQPVPGIIDIIKNL